MKTTFRLNSDRKKVLIFAPYFPPRPRVGAIRPYRFAKYLKKLNWEVSVVCIQDQIHTLSEDEISNLEGVNIVELVSPLDRTQKKKEVKGSSSKSKDVRANKFIKWLDNSFPVDTWLPFFHFKRKEIKQIIQSSQPDVIFTTSDPWSGAYVCGKIAKELGIKWIADFRDPWTLCNVRFKERKDYSRKVDQGVEKFILESADAITFTANATMEKYRQAYKFASSKTHVIYNSFDLDNSSIKDPRLYVSTKNRLDVLFLGVFRELSNAEGILKVLEIVKSKQPAILHKIFIHSYGSLTFEDLNKAQSLGIEDNFIKRDKVPSSLVHKEIESADLLLLSTELNRNDIIPAKLFDYLISGTPIFSLHQNPETKHILEETGTGNQFLLDEFEKAADFIIDMMNTGYELVPNKSIIETYSINHTVVELDNLLTKVIQE